MSETDYQIPNAVIDVLEETGGPAEKVFREHAGVSVAGLAEATDIPTTRIDAIEHGSTPTDEELTAIGEALAVPVDLLVDE